MSPFLIDVLFNELYIWAKCIFKQVFKFAWLLGWGQFGLFLSVYLFFLSSSLDKVLLSLSLIIVAVTFLALLITLLISITALIRPYCCCFWFEYVISPLSFRMLQCTVLSLLLYLLLKFSFSCFDLLINFFLHSTSVYDSLLTHGFLFL